MCGECVRYHKLDVSLGLEQCLVLVVQQCVFVAMVLVCDGCLEVVSVGNSA